MKDNRAPFQSLSEDSVPECFSSLPTPCYVLDEKQLRHNAELLCGIQQRTGAKILLAQKAFSNYDLYPVLAPFLAGTEASGLYEARLGHEEMPDHEVHVFCAAYREQDMDELYHYADHLVFNSISQLKRFGPAAKQAGLSIGLRINPEHSTQEGHEIYDPCSPSSRLGVTFNRWNEEMDEESISLLDGLHFHTLCEQNADALEETLLAFEANFGTVLPKMKWLNIGGGHHITRPDYDVSRLERCISKITQKYGLQVYLEPGEAVALNAGWLVATVLDSFKSGGFTHIILDCSAACHMPDILEMPYRPPIFCAGEPNERKFTVKIGCPTCLAGDSIGDYSFDSVPQIGDRIIFGDMAIYTTCKNNTFNGMPLPNIYKRNNDGSFTQLTSFGYHDFKHKLGS